MKLCISFSAGFALKRCHDSKIISSTALPKMLKSSTLTSVLHPCSVTTVCGGRHESEPVLKTTSMHAYVRLVRAHIQCYECTFGSTNAHKTTKFINQRWAHGIIGSLLTKTNLIWYFDGSEHNSSFSFSDCLPKYGSYE